MSAIVDAFDRIHRDTPDRLLVVLPASRVGLTARDLHERARVLADRLKGAGLGRDTVLLSAAGNRADAIALLLACRQLDVPLMPVDRGTTPQEIRDLADCFGAAALVVEPGDEFPNGVALGGGLSLVRRRGAEPPSGAAQSALLKLTSGSTGAAKATCTSEAQIVTDARQIMAAMDIRAADTQIAIIPLSHAYGLGNLVLPVLLQGTCIVLRDAFMPQQLPDDARRYSANMLPGVPFMFEHFLAHPPDGGWPATLDRLISAGAPLDPRTALAFHDRFGPKIHSFYGTSETGGISYDDTPDPDREPTVGRPLPGVEVTLKFVDGTAPGEGRVHVRSGAACDSYAGGVDADSFIDGGFLTGDLGRFDHRGHLVLTGRLSSFVNVAGRKVQPQEVERVLREAPGVVDVRVLGVADSRRGEQLAACIVANGEPPRPIDLRRFCAHRLAPHKIPRQFLIVDAIPTTARGKTDRVRLRALVEERLGREADGVAL